MTWLYLSIFAAFLWTVVNVVDKIIVSRLVRNPRLPVIASGLVKIAVGATIIAITGVIPKTTQFIVGLLAGASYMVATLFYYSAMQREEASRVVPMFALGNVWLPIAAAVFLGERFGVSIYLSIAIIVVGSFLIMWRPGSGIAYSRSATLLMVASTAGYALYALAVKHLVGFHTFWVAAAYPMIGAVLVVVPFMILHCHDVRGTRRAAWGAMVGSESINSAALIIFSLAAATGFISLVNAALASQYVFIFFIGLILSRFFPRILKEDLTPCLVALKLFAIFLIVGGVVWIALRA